jgi:hypothetical protein
LRNLTLTFANILKFVDMKMMFSVAFVVLFIVSCEKAPIEKTPITENIEQKEWVAPNVGAATSVLKLAINTANSETERMGLSKYKAYILDLRDGFSAALAEVEKEAKTEIDFNKNIKAAISYIESNIEKTNGMISGFTIEQNEGLKKYNAYSVTALEELEDLIN